ncbi:MAG: ABC transporter substrate-binding protein [Spirochaetota bacterium]
MKKWCIITVAVLGFLFSSITVFAAGQKEEAPKALPEKIVVGCLEPLTGSYAVFGTEAKIGMEIAIKHINETGGIASLKGIPLSLVAEDCGESPDSAKLGAESLISKYHPVAILGLYISRLTITASEVMERNKVILVTDALADSLTAMGRRYLFRPSANAGQYGSSAVEFLADIAKKKGFDMSKSRVALINEDSAFGRSVAMGAVNAALGKGVTIVYHKEYPYDSSDVTSIVSDITNAKADVVLHCPYFMDAILFAKTFREKGKIPKFIAGMGACGYVDDNSIKALGQTGNYYSNTYGYNPEKNTTWNQKFVKDFKAQTRNLPTDSSGMNYYAMWVLKEALELSGRLFPDDPLNPENLRQAFLKLDITSGPAVDTFPTNRFTFTETGDNPHARAVVMQVINGQPKVVWPFADAQAEAVFPRPDATY